MKSITINDSRFLKPAFLLFLHTPESTWKSQLELHLNCGLFPRTKRGIHSVYEEEEDEEEVNPILMGTWP